MKQLIILLFILSAFSCKQSFTSISNLESNWETRGDASWTFLENEIIGEAKGDPGYICLKNDYDNFLLELEFLPDSTINSGIFLRCKDEEIGASTCYEINIWDLGIFAK